MIKYQEDQTVMNPKTQNFLDLYFEAIDENIDDVVEELKSAGINAAEIHNEILYMIKQKKAELKIEKGKLLKERISEIVKLKTESANATVNEKRYAIAARKLGSLDQEDIQSIKNDAGLLEDIGELLGKLESGDIESIKKDSILLKDIGKLIDGDADDTGKTSR